MFLFDANNKNLHFNITDYDYLAIKDRIVNPKSILRCWKDQI
jgi:hypothetical protein